jgi:hypothetical protein
MTGSNTVMEDLLPSLSSDDEGNHVALEEVADDSDGEEDEAINVEFGGILVRSQPDID